jgi:hypothetical protein
LDVKLTKVAEVVPVPPDATGRGTANETFWLASIVTAVVAEPPVLRSNEPEVSAVCTSAVPALVPAVIELMFFFP